ncbi:complement C3-like [Chiloscyllium plagiosum]|uniref:complement C3-like n=1 Tax=Chiloscyllium plagiosum TaxID=36176 RepID=UPI001CB8072F|nr:complement C3-like [Chiloscyllium plagiosum]
MRTSLLLVVLVVFPALCQCSPLYILTAPNVLRVESEENVVVEGHNSNKDLDVEIRLQFFPKNNIIIFRAHAALSNNNNQISVPVKIPSERIPKDTKLPEYVVLEAISIAFHLERVILISYQTGHIFIQTDKPIYTPTQTVLYRLLTVNNDMKPIKKTVLADFVNPQGVIVRRDEIFAKDASGITGSTFKVPEIVNIGVWKIAASYKEASHVNYTTEFEVKEYVLPSFEVTLEGEKHFFYVDDNRLDVSITARFTYGKPVEGRAFVMFGIMKDGERIGIPSSLQSVGIIDGRGDASLTSEVFKTSFPDIYELVGCSIYITASVITHTGSDMVEAEKSGIKIVTSPYTILFTKTSKYYKPGMPFDLMVYVTNPDGSPANGIPVMVNGGQSHSKTQHDGIARLTLNTVGQPQNIQVKVETNVPNTPKARQASASMVAQPYQTQAGSMNYLHIGIQPAELSPGSNLVVHLSLRNDNAGIQNQIKYFTYMLINKGKIVTVGRQSREIGQIVVNMLIPITSDLIPSFRLLVYYYVTKGANIEMVADSVWIDVKDTCMGTLVVSAANQHDENKIYKPGKQFQLKITGDSGATVGLVAVDKAVFVLNKKNKITQRKIWDVVEKNDIGCTPGSGSDVLGVFTDAGLTIITSSDLKTPTRTELKCKQPMKRRRRATRLMDVKMANLNRYKANKFTENCCKGGMKTNPMGLSCNSRARRVHGEECRAAFLDCCNSIQQFKNLQRSTQMTLARSDDDDYYIPYEDIMSRSDFPESWLWILKTLPTNDRQGVVTKDISGYLKDSITTWEIQAVSVSPQKGICIAQPYELTVQKDFFIDLRLPYSVIRNEQVEIRAILYNYDDDEIKVRVEIPYNENICSGAKPTERFKKIVIIPGKGSIAVPYVIVPLIIGQIDIEVKASVFDKLVADAVRKSLRVVPEGKKVDCPVQTFELDPKGRQQTIDIDIKVPDDVVPNTEPLSFISVQGDVLAQTIENSIDGAKLKHLIRVPTGCGEQNMASITPGVIVTNFLDKTMQWERVGMDNRDTSVRNIQRGYAQQLAYRQSSGAYAAFTGRVPSTWLTAYVVKVFAMSYNLIMVQPDILCGAAKWLILNKQKPDGSFREDSPVIHGEMIGGVKGSESDSSLTAFVLIALDEAKTVCSPYIEGYEDSIQKAGDYLNGHFDNLKRAYSVAITAYALSLLKINKLNTLMEFASGDQSYWADADGANSLYTIEATGYSLLTLVQLKEFDKAGKLVKWLSRRSEYGGGFSTTQATMVALQALAKYQMDIPEVKEIDLDVKVLIPGRNRPVSWHFDSTSKYVAKSERMSALEKFTIQANGKGQGTVKVLTSYHALLSKQVKECKKFDVRVSVEEIPQAHRPQDALNSLLITVCAQYRGDADSSMAIADISMLTGFSPDLADLDLLQNGVDTYISRFELDKALSAQGSLIIYLDSVSHLEETCFGFKVHQFFKVGLIQPASVKIYEYYDTENSCTKFYNVNERSSMLSKICQGDVCRCAEGSCITAKLPEQRISPGVREDKACEHGTDYVYKIAFKKKEKRDNYIYYEMEVKSVIKQGSDDVIEGQVRELITHASCEETFNVDLENDYLLMGQGSDLWSDGKRISYLIGDTTWLEMWPTEEQCQNNRYRSLCQSLAEFSEILMINGCPT